MINESLWFFSCVSNILAVAFLASLWRSCLSSFLQADGT